MNRTEQHRSAIVHPPRLKVPADCVKKFSVRLSFLDEHCFWFGIVKRTESAQVIPILLGEIRNRPGGW
jgi:hypothetical protein